MMAWRAMNGWGRAAATTLKSAACAAAVGATGSVALAACPPEWTEAALTGPSIRAYPGMVYDSGASRVLLYGGSRSSTYYRDLWQWDDGVWTLVDSGASGPGVRNAVFIAYDPLRARTVLFGGGGTSTNDTWEWNGTAWAQVATSGPPWRGFGGMCYVDWQQRCVLFGGWSGGFNYFSDTWSWDGSAWTQVGIGGAAPHPRAFHAMAHDASRGRIVMHGGLWNDAASINYLGDTWEWDGTSWSELNPAHSPGIRAYHTLTYDPVGKRVLLFGGFDFSTYYNDVWTWDGVDWVQLPYGPTAPLGRQAHGAAFDEASDELVIFGGARGGAYRNDTWTASIPLAPEIQAHPLDVEVCPADSAVFNVAASGTPPLTFQWQRDDPAAPGEGPWLDLLDGPTGNGSLILGAETEVLTISNVTTADATAFRCVVTNACAQVTSHPAALSLCAGCPGDLNGDGMVDLDDLSILLVHFGQSSGATYADGDLDGDGDVDLLDLSALLIGFGTSCL